MTFVNGAIKEGYRGMGEGTSRTQAYFPAYSPQSPQSPPPPRPPSYLLPSYAPPIPPCRPPRASRPVRAHHRPVPPRARSLVHGADHTPAREAGRTLAREAGRARGREAGRTPGRGYRTRGPVGVVRTGPGAGDPRPTAAGMAAQAGATGTAMAHNRAVPAAEVRERGERRSLVAGDRAGSGSGKVGVGCSRAGVGGTADGPGNIASR